MNEQNTDEKMNDAVFQVWYSYFLEILTARFWSRVDKCISLLQLTFGSAILLASSYSQIFGVLLVVLSAVQMSFRPGESSAVASRQAEKYLHLTEKLDKYNADEIKDRLHTISSYDTDEIGTLCSVAYVRTSIKLSRTENSQYYDNLGLWGKFIAWVASDLPKELKK
ncbi:hypothetical protein CIX30_13530 [Salmonella enterica]|nr:hypothetical protein [Salmonella enterica]ECE6540369.1 hypothetical protein [Salmonella enterica subsp. enterica]ECS7525578.1 hypothetical protein [Salmonella enterica]EJX9799410.1 hypothetical protein [Salmonella enterica]